jgi:hypothetical protein
VAVLRLVVLLLLAAIAAACGNVGEPAHPADDSSSRTEAMPMSTTLELRALRIEPTDDDAIAALDRLADVEGPVDDTTWNDMVALARSLVGEPAEVEEKDRRWGAVQAWREGTLVAVSRHGRWVDIYYEADTARSATDDEFYAVLNRLRDAGLTVLQGEDMDEVGPDVTVAEMVAAQNAAMGL